MDAVATPPVAASPAVTRETLMANSRLTFEDKVIEKIAALCAREIDGLLGMDGTMMDNLTETFLAARISPKASQLKLARNK